jgi:hypothetical protein
MFNKILENIKGLVTKALNKAVALWNTLSDWLTVEKAETIAATLALSGIVCVDLIGLWLALPFLVGAAALTVLIFHAHYNFEPDVHIGNLSCS